jgi:hypothetical protein
MKSQIVNNILNLKLECAKLPDIPTDTDFSKWRRIKVTKFVENKTLISKNQK